MTNMKTLEFDQFIDAPVERVWEMMLGEATYTQWTSVFAEGSTFEGSWEEGSKIKLLDPSSGDGMYAEIAENRKHEFISIRHLGFIFKGVIDTESEKVSWAPAYENYTFTKQDGGTVVHVDQDILPEYEEMFFRLWPQALLKLKEICEAN